MAGQLSENRKHLDTFLVDNSELERLNARLAAFNMFRVLRIERAEIRHSNVLAWLLTPGESHGLGDLFLRRFMSRLLMENESVDVTLTPAQVELMDLSDVEVLREWQNIDVLARSRSGHWALLIENKIGSKEKKGALPRYRDRVHDEMRGVQIIPVLLTVEGEDPSETGKEAGYVALSHAHVLDLADRMIEQNRKRIPSDAATFLEHYLDILRRITMQDSELVELCKAIYRKHRQAIDLVVEYGATSQIIDCCEAHPPNSSGRRNVEVPRDAPSSSMTSRSYLGPPFTAGYSIALSSSLPARRLWRRAGQEPRRMTYFTRPEGRA